MTLKTESMSWIGSFSHRNRPPSDRKSNTSSLEMPEPARLTPKRPKTSPHRELLKLRKPKHPATANLKLSCAFLHVRCLKTAKSGHPTITALEKMPKKIAGLPGKKSLNN